MDTSTVFESSNDVTEERLAVLTLLVDLDPHSVDHYHTEIKDIQSRLMIKQRLREVEQSKIYVDLEGVRKNVDKNMRESFARYVSYVEHGLDSDNLTLREVARKKAAEGAIEGLLTLTLPKNEMNQLVDSMLIEFRDQFVSSAEHGLNWYLSVRIRHGTFSGHLRSPLEAANLVTQRDRTTGEYKDNSHWPQKLGIQDQELNHYLSKRLGEFSKGFDDLIQEILSDWLQIKRIPGEKGLFNFVLLEAHGRLLRSAIRANSAYEQFVEEVFSLLNEMLEWNLSQIRRQIEKEAKRRVDEMLNSLLLDIGQLIYSTDIRDLSNAIRAVQTEMQIAFDRVIEWFRLSRTTAFEPFNLEDAVNISMESVRTFSPAFSAEVRIEHRELEVPFHGKQLSTIVDIFFIVFENIVRHSDISENPRANVTITYGENSIHFRVENRVGQNVATESSKGKINALKAAMRERKPLTPISSEGGTGLLKIWRI